MADGTTVDSLQIEIEASSTEAEKKVDALAAALERLKKATTGFGNIGDRIKEIGSSASDTPAAAKTRQRRQALERATRPEAQRATSNVDLGKTASQIEATDKKIEKAKASIAELNEQIRMLGFAHDQEQGAQLTERLNEQLKEQQGILDGLIQKREKLSSVMMTGTAKEPKQTEDPWAEIKAQLKGSTLGDLVGDTGSVDEAVSRMVESESSLQKKLGILQRIFETVQKMSGTKIDIGSAGGLKELLGKDLSLQNIIPKGVSGALGKAGDAFKKFADKGLEFASSHPAIAAAMVGLKIAAQTLFRAMKDFAKFSFSALKKGFEVVAGAAKKLTSALGNLVKAGIKKAAAGMKSLTASIGSRFSKPFTDAIKSFNKWKNAVGRIAFYRAVREAVKAVTDGFRTGIENLYQYSRMVGTEFAPAMNSLATSALYLKNSLGAMAAPLIQALAPAVDFLIDKFVALINVIGKAFAVLTGKSVYTQAKKHAVDYADAANSASKATQKFLLGIDELTILENPSGGAGSALEDYGSMFEEVEIDQDQFDWVKQIREAIENGEWRSVGELVADKLNEIVDSWDSYAWGVKLGGLLNNGLNVAYGFLTTFDFEKFGSKVADGLNGIFDTVDWDLLGQTFAAKWNALFDFIYGFATTLKWHEIGLDISQAINGFLDELDATKAAQAVSTFVTGLFDMLNTAISETNWNVLGDKLGQFISEVDWHGAIYGALSIVTNGLAALKEGLDSFLRSWTWQDTAQQTYTAVNQAFSDVDWSGLGTTLSNAFTTAFNFLRETIDGISWENIGSDVAEALNNIRWTELLSSLATTISVALNAVVSTLGTLAKDLEWEKVGEALGNAINDLFEKFDFDSFYTGLESLVRGIINGLSTTIETVDWKEVGQKIVDALKKVDWKGLLADVGTLIGDTFYAALELVFSDPVGLLEIGVNIVEGILQGIINQFAGIGRWLKEHLVDPFINGVKELFGIHSPSTVMRDDVGANLIAGLLEGISGAWGGIVEFFGGKVDALKEFFSGAWESIKTTASEKWEAIKTSLGTTWDNIKTSAGEKFTAVKESISTAWENVKTSTGEKWESIKSTLGSAWETLKTNAGTTFENIKSTVAEKWESVKSDTSEKWDRVKSTLSDAWDNMKSTATSKLADIKVSISNTWGDIVSSAVSWGKDLCSNLADGIRSGIGWVKNAVSSVADKMSSYIHFSEPDIGPLSDFHTYMPDMMNLMAKGIKDNSYLAVNAASDLADTMSKTLGNIEPVEPKFSVHEDLLASVHPHYSGGNAEAVNVSSEEGQSSNSMEVINAVFAAAQQIVNAINENSDRPINIDWSSVASGMTSMQNRQNMMYGKTLQNY